MKFSMTGQEKGDLLIRSHLYYAVTSIKQSPLLSSHLY
jgi:hypothetical protein